MTPPLHSASPFGFRVMTWNIHKGVGGVDRRYNLDRTVEVIRHYNPDVVLLQEVAQQIPSLRFEDQLEELSERLEYHSAFHPEHQFKRGSYGNLIFSRHPIDEVQHLDLTIGWRKRRGALLGRTAVTLNGRKHTLRVTNLHLGLAGSERGQQLQRFVESSVFRQIPPDEPLLVGGDLNDLWGTLGRAHLIPQGLSRAGTPHFTFPAFAPIRPLDGLFHRGALHVARCAVGRTKAARSASDHLLLYADFESA